MEEKYARNDRGEEPADNGVPAKLKVLWGKNVVPEKPRGFLGC